MEPAGTLEGLFIAAFLILVAASAAVTLSMAVLGLVDRLFAPKRKEPQTPQENPEPEIDLDALLEKLDAEKDEDEQPRREGLRRYG